MFHLLPSADTAIKTRLNQRVFTDPVVTESLNTDRQRSIEIYITYV